MLRTFNFLSIYVFFNLALPFVELGRCSAISISHADEPATSFDPDQCEAKIERWNEKEKSSSHSVTGVSCSIPYARPIDLKRSSVAQILTGISKEKGAPENSYRLELKQYTSAHLPNQFKQLISAFKESIRENSQYLNRIRPSGFLEAVRSEAYEDAKNVRDTALGECQLLGLMKNGAKDLPLSSMSTYVRDFVQRALDYADGQNLKGVTVRLDPITQNPVAVTIPPDLVAAEQLKKHVRALYGSALMNQNFQAYETLARLSRRVEMNDTGYKGNRLSRLLPSLDTCSQWKPDFGGDLKAAYTISNRHEDLKRQASNILSERVPPGSLSQELKEVSGSLDETAIAKQFDSVERNRRKLEVSLDTAEAEFNSSSTDEARFEIYSELVEKMGSFFPGALAKYFKNNSNEIALCGLLQWNEKKELTDSIKKIVKYGAVVALVSVTGGVAAPVAEMILLANVANGLFIAYNVESAVIGIASNIPKYEQIEQARTIQFMSQRDTSMAGYSLNTVIAGQMAVAFVNIRGAIGALRNSAKLAEGWKNLIKEYPVAARSQFLKAHFFLANNEENYLQQTINGKTVETLLQEAQHLYDKLASGSLGRTRILAKLIPRLHLVTLKMIREAVSRKAVEEYVSESIKDLISGELKPELRMALKELSSIMVRIEFDVLERSKNNYDGYPIVSAAGNVSER